MTMLGAAVAAGVTAADGGDHPPQPAPLKARTRKVYDVPFESPAISQESAVVRQLPPVGDDVTWKVETGNDPGVSTGLHDTLADEFPGAAIGAMGAAGGIGAGGAW
jgi:hypothetical protein